MSNFRLSETEKTRHFLLLREKLGIDKPIVVMAATREPLDKSEKEAVNMVARASGEGRPMARPNRQEYQEWDMTQKEKDIAVKFLKLIQYHPRKVASIMDGDTPTADPDKMAVDSIAISSQHEYVYR